METSFHKHLKVMHMDHASILPLHSLPANHADSDFSVSRTLQLLADSINLSSNAILMAFLQQESIRKSRLSPSKFIESTLKPSEQRHLNNAAALQPAHGTCSAEANRANPHSSPLSHGYHNHIRHNRDAHAMRCTRARASHNDSTYYPNIQCILCLEWVCSRNR